MDPARFTRIDETAWRIEKVAGMRVPAIIFADEELIRAMDDKVYEQATNVAKLPGIVKGAYAMPDAHWGYGFPIGGVAAFDPDDGGVVSAGGVGFDISCGVRTMLMGLATPDIAPVQKALADQLCRDIPAGVGSEGAITLDEAEMDEMLAGGAAWAIARGYGAARWRAPARIASPRAPSTGRRAKWARSAPAITISKCRWWPRYSTPPRRPRSGLRAMTCS